MTDISSYAEIVLRSTAVYLFLVIAIRLFGKKELSQLSTTDLVFIVLISNSVQNAMVGSDSSLQGGIIAASVLFVLNYILKRVMYTSPQFKDAVEGKPVILVHEGKLDIDHLHKERITMDELEETIREHGVDSYKHVKLAIMEVDGNISVISGENNVLRQTHHKIKRRQKSLTGIS
jgi:uncharacterized membrane protein YcaP (DUF421 family)